MKKSRSQAIYAPLAQIQLDLREDLTVINQLLQVVQNNNLRLKELYIYNPFKLIKNTSNR